MFCIFSTFPRPVKKIIIIRQPLVEEGRIRKDREKADLSLAFTPQLIVGTAICCTEFKSLLGLLVARKIPISISSVPCQGSVPTARNTEPQWVVSVWWKGV